MREEVTNHLDKPFARARWLELDRDLVGIHVNTSNACAFVEEQASKHVGRAVALHLGTPHVGFVSHTGKASIEFEAHDTRV